MAEAIKPKDQSEPVYLDATDVEEYIRAGKTASIVPNDNGIPEIVCHDDKGKYQAAPADYPVFVGYPYLKVNFTTTFDEDNRPRRERTDAVAVALPPEFDLKFVRFDDPSHCAIFVRPV